MKLAVITDLHANREAVETCLEQARAAGVDRFAFLGDFVGYGADPAWVLDQVRDLVERNNAIAVLGNHDNATVREPSAAMDPDAVATAQWTRDQLDASQLKFLGSLPLTATLGDCLFVHANAWAPAEWAYIHGRGDAICPIAEGRFLASGIKNAQFVELDSANHILLEGEPAWGRFCDAVLEFMGLGAGAVDPAFASLSTRERQILVLITEGLGNAAIGERLSISEKTVRNHISNVFDKLGVWTRAQAIVLARDRGFGA